MILRKAREEEINDLTDISKAAFATDIHFGAKVSDGPPGYDSYEWHRQMFIGNHLFIFKNESEIIGGAILFVDGPSLYVGRIFLSPKFFRQGYGRKLMEEIENLYSEVEIIRLDTPIWNERTNHFYRKCGYVETGRDQESIYFEKKINIGKN